MAKRGIVGVLTGMLSRNNAELLVLVLSNGMSFADLAAVIEVWNRARKCGRCRASARLMRLTRAAGAEEQVKVDRHARAARALLERVHQDGLQNLGR